MRINCVPVQELHKIHLFAEFREIKMLPKALLRTINSKNGLDKNKISPKYTLNTGHGYFFYDKLNYIYDRFEELSYEVIRRGINTNSFEITKIDIPELMNNWIPTKEDIEINRERINLRISQKPHLYLR